MNFFCYPSVLGAKALIENHYWKYEFAMENVSMYSTFFNNAHVLLSLGKTDNVVCVYSSVKRYKLQSYQGLAVSAEHGLGNNVFSFRVDTRNVETAIEDDEDVVYDEYDSTLCRPEHRLFFNSANVRSFDWSVLKLNEDFKLICDRDDDEPPFYLIKTTPYCQVACHRTRGECKHMGKSMRNISGGYKQLLFDIQSTMRFVCPCSFIEYVNEQHSTAKFTHVLMSYKLSQFFLHF